MSMMGTPSSQRAIYSLCVCLLVSASCVLVYSMLIGRLPTTLLYATRQQIVNAFSGEKTSSQVDSTMLFVNGTSNRTKIILFWTGWYGSKIWFNLHESDMGTAMFQNKHCTRHPNCLLTHDHSKLKDADLLLFYYSDKPNWPRVRYPNQYYAHFMFEAPGHRRSFLDRYEGKINVTINFRHDADLHIPYATILPKPSPSKYIPRVPLVNKTKMVIWPVSHCKTFSHREDYVRELSKYINVDIYGTCGKYNCPRSRTLGCLEDWENTYKFYLSFENSICEDYITEKMFQPLRYELIPVVLGGGNYSADAPPHSVINARDFKSPKALADFLHQLARDEERYHSYFAWKSQYEHVRMQDWLMCRLCAALHEDTFPRRPARRHYADYWYGSHGEKCDFRTIENMRKAGGW